jgi:hypothetical protein
MSESKKSVLCVISNLPSNLKRNMIREACKGGQFVTVEWINKKGTLSKCNGRVGVTCHLVKPENRKRKASTKPAPDHVLNLRKMGKGYRSVTLDEVVTVRAGGKVIHFSG